MPTDESEIKLSDAYNRASKESSPESLDNAVLAMARAELTSPRSGWFQPLAIAATLVIGVGFALRITDYGTLTQPESSAPRPADAKLQQYSPQEPETDSAESAAPAAEESLSESLANPAVQAPAMNRVLEKRQASRAPQVEELSRQANERAKSELDGAMRDFPATLEFEPKSASPGNALFADDTLSERRHACSEKSEDVAQWLDCIRDLRENGNNEAATVAEEALYLRFPELKPEPKP